jgi:hypothetical protein
MNDFFATSNERMNAYRRFANETTFAACRLVHYAGSNKPNAADVSPDEVEKEILGCLAEGFHVDWLCVHEKLYVCVQEPDCPIPPWKALSQRKHLSM